MADDTDGWLPNQPPVDWRSLTWSQAAQSDALSRPSEPMAACVWTFQAPPACQPVLAPPSGPPAGGVPSRVREPGGSTKPSLLPQPDFSKDVVSDNERDPEELASDRAWEAWLADRPKRKEAVLGGLSGDPSELTASRLAAVSRMIASRMSGGGGQTGSGPRVVPTPDPVPYAGDVPVEVSDLDRKLWAAIGRGGRRSGPGVVWEGDRR